MNQIFIWILNQSINAVYLILAVLAVRLLVKKAPKWISCALWGLVAFKLVMPFSFESALSLVPSKEPIPKNIEYAEKPHIESGISVINSAVNPLIENSLSPKSVENSVNPMQIAVSAAAFVWAAGMILMLVYFCVSWLAVKRRTALSQRVRDNIYIKDGIAGPFILGVARPKIYLPDGLTGEQMGYILEHEISHIKRLDHLWKPLGYLILTVYWFNPFCWISYLLLCRDIELACDERVTKDKDKEWKAVYCQILLDCGTNIRQRKIITACPIAFGEVSIKERVKAVLNYKKPAFWMRIAAIMACIITAVCFAANPANTRASDLGPSNGPDPADQAEIQDDIGLISGQTQSDEPISTTASGEDSAIRSAIRGHNSKTDDPTGILACVSFIMLEETVSTPLNGADGAARAVYYGWALYDEYMPSGFRLANISSSHIPVVLSFDINEKDGYSLAEYWEPRDGAYFASDIREKVPAHIYEDMIDSRKFFLRQKQDCYNQMVDALYVDPFMAMEGLLGIVTESPKESSDPQDYIDAHMEEYREMTYFGTHALKYCFSRFEKGGETGLEGQIMMRVCGDAAASMGEEPLIFSMPSNGTLTGQMWYDAFRNNALQLAEQYSPIELAERNPASCLLLEMLGEL